MKEVEGVPGLVEQMLARKKDLDRVGKGSTIYSYLVMDFIYILKHHTKYEYYFFL